MKQRGKHQTLTKEIKSQVEKIEKLPGVKKIIIGPTINKRSRNKPERGSVGNVGSLKYQSNIDSGIKMRANTSRGTMTLYVYCDDREVIKDFLEK